MSYELRVMSNEFIAQGLDLSSQTKNSALGTQHSELLKSPLASRYRLITHHY